MASDKMPEWIRIFFCPQCGRKFWQQTAVWRQDSGVCDNCDFNNQNGRRLL